MQEDECKDCKYFRKYDWPGEVKGRCFYGRSQIYRNRPEEAQNKGACEFFEPALSTT